MRATVGDRIVVASGVVGGAVRDGVIVGCAHEDGTPPYRVRWTDTEEESLVFPGVDAVVQRDGAGGDGAAAQSPEPARALTWDVRVTLMEAAGNTTAEATLTPRPDVGSLRGVGHARKDPGDTEVAVIGDEVAAARALRRLADALLDQAKQDISAQTGNPAHVHP